MTFFFRFDQRDSNSCLKFGQLTAEWLKASVPDLQMKQRAPSLFESHGTPPLRPNCPMSLTCCYKCFTKSDYCSDIAQNCDREIFERQLFAKFIRGQLVSLMPIVSIFGVKINSAHNDLGSRPTSHFVPDSHFQPDLGFISCFCSQTFTLLSRYYHVIIVKLSIL